MEYIPIADAAPLQHRDGLAHMLVHGVVLLMAVAVLLHGLCLAEPWLPGRRPPAAEEADQ